MKMYRFLLLAAIICSLASCKKEFGLNQSTSAPSTLSADDIFNSAGIKNNISIKASDFVTEINNKYLPLKPGTIYHYLNAVKEDKVSVEHITVTVTYDTKTILGVKCRVVHDQVEVDGEISEDTYDWYAQDIWGNVWYFGENTKAYSDGEIDSAGSFEAGVDGALPGIIMLAHPEKHIGFQYYQEYDPGNAVDQATALNVNSTANVVYGTFNNCLVTEEYTALEPDVLEYKHYAPGIGEVLTVLNVGGEERQELISISHY